MSGTNGRSPGGEMTLAVELSAARRLADPAGAFEEAREWSRHVWVVANDEEAVDRFVDDHGLRQDFDLDGRDKWLALSEVREATTTDRHVLVGTTPEDRRAAEHTGWEFRHVREAAEKAGWAISTDRDRGIISRVRTALAGLFGSDGSG